jgi:hypothetical protein
MYFAEANPFEEVDKFVLSIRKSTGALRQTTTLNGMNYHPKTIKSTFLALSVSIPSDILSWDREGMTLTVVI